jgi:type I restriction enzyme S subunit
VYPEFGARSFGKGLFHKPTLSGADLDWQKLFRVHAGDLVISNIIAWEGAIAVAGEVDHSPEA